MSISRGFAGQRRIWLPSSLTEKALLNPVTSRVVIHSIGYFPDAYGHYIDRPNGCAEQLLIYCTKGKGYYTLDGKTYEVGEQQYFVLPAYTRHSYRSDDNDPWSIYYIHFKGPGSDYVAEQLKGLHTLSFSDTSRIKDRISMFNEILNILEIDYSETGIMYANMNLYSLLASFMSVDTFRKAKYPNTSEDTNSFTSRVCHLLEDNIEGHFSIKELSAMFDCSPSYFHRKFHAETGYSPMDYFLLLKMTKAKEILEQSTLKLNQIAHILGYDDVSFFSRYFKKVFGISPKIYRESLKK